MPLAFVRQFVKLESASGVLLFVATLTALILTNSPFADSYQSFLTTPLEFQIGNLYFAKPLLFWINEGLMTVFFLIVGLELKREFFASELADVSRFVLPGIAALGGMIVPACIFSLINFNHPETLKGWAIPVATDIAFVLGVLSLFGKRIPLGLKLFLMALAIFDDIGAIIIIAIFYTNDLSYLALLSAFLVLIVLQIFNRLGFRNLILYVLGGVMLWICTLKSGVHPTISGVLLAFVIPGHKEKNLSPSLRLENILHPWVAFLVMPVFALAIAGVSLSGLELKIIFDYVSWGIILGLVLGKQLGVFSFTWASIRMGWGKFPKGTTWLEVFGMAILCGIGFTMSLFLGTLAFKMDDPIYLTEVRLGVLIGSLISGLLGAGILFSALKMKGGCKLEAS